MNAADQKKRDDYIIERIEDNICYAIQMQYARQYMSSWDFFGWVWKSCQKLPWWSSFGDEVIYDESDVYHEKHRQAITDLEWFVHPDHTDRFLDAIYKFMKEMKP